MTAPPWAAAWITPPPKFSPKLWISPPFLLTGETISEFYLAPVGTTNWGGNQCKNDKDGTVDSDERLRITGISPGTYDARLKDVSGRVCYARNLNIKAGDIFSLEEKDLTDCGK